LKVSSLSLAGPSTFLTAAKASNEAPQDPQLTASESVSYSRFQISLDSVSRSSLTDTSLTIPALPSGGAGFRHFFVFMTYRHLSSKISSVSNANSFYGTGGNPTQATTPNVSLTVNGASTTLITAGNSAFNGTALFKGQSDLSAGTATIVYNYDSSQGGNYAINLYVLDYITDIQFLGRIRRNTGFTSPNTFGDLTITASDISQTGTTHNFRAAVVTCSNAGKLEIDRGNATSSEPAYTSDLSNQDNGTNERNASHHLFHAQTTDLNMVSGISGFNAGNGHSIVALLAKIK